MHVMYICVYRERFYYDYVTVIYIYIYIYIYMYIHIHSIAGSKDAEAFIGKDVCRLAYVYSGMAPLTDHLPHWPRKG